MEIRRRLLMQPPRTYIKNGLVLWLDGIDKGNVPGSWVDKINGYEFEGVGNPTFGDNYVATENDKYLRNTTFTCPSSDDSTIEVVISDFRGIQTQLIFMSKGYGQIAFGIYSASIIWNAGNTGYSKPKAKLPDNLFKVASITNGTYIFDGESIQTLGTDYWASPDQYNYIGKRSSGNAFIGKIHAIRIYNRQLTADEMLRNQRIDNKRFNLGLNI